MLDIFIAMQIRAVEERRLAEYHPKGSKLWLVHIEQAVQLEEQVRNGCEVTDELFGNYGEYPEEKKTKSCEYKKRKKSKAQHKCAGECNSTRCKH